MLPVSPNQPRSVSVNSARSYSPVPYSVTGTALRETDVRKGSITPSWAAYALSQRLPLSPYILQVLARRLDTSSVDVRERLRWILTTQTRLYPTPKR